MNLTQLAQVLPNLHKQLTPIFLWGPPGIGKTEMVQDYFSSIGQPCFVLEMNLLDLTDLGRFPVPNRDSREIEYYTPTFWPKFQAGCLLLDEFNATPNRAVMLAANRLLRERKVADYSLPESVWVVCTGNRTTDGAMGQSLPTSTANRIIHINVDFDVRSFQQYCWDHKINNLIPAFVERFPELAYTFDAKNKSAAFSSPRTLVELSKHIGLYPDELKLEIYSGIVGQSTGATFYHFEKLFNALPSPKTILNDPKGASIPSDPSILFVTVVGLQNIADKNTLEAIWEYGQRLSNSFQSFLINGIYLKNKQLDVVTQKYPKGVLIDALTKLANQCM